MMTIHAILLAVSLLTGYDTDMRRDERYREQVHYSPAQNWMNDPCGMYYLDGRWHMYYQYNLYGNYCDLGRVSWGHASSTDLIHWTEHQPVIVWDREGAIFTGCSVVDSANVSGYGRNAVLSFYTIAAGTQRIGLAVSVDGGYTFSKKGEIIHSDFADFRDPKVTYDPVRRRWVMLIARGNAHTLELWHSTNLRQWNFGSVITLDNERANRGQYECPDLLYFPEHDKWVLVLNINPGGLYTHSGCIYFVGQFDGLNFTPDAEGERWMDYGPDYYAALTYSNTPDGRIIQTGWLNNWGYVDLVPSSPKSAMALPRVVSLDSVAGTWRLRTDLIDEIETLANDKARDAMLVRATLSLHQPSEITFSNRHGQRFVISTDVANRRILACRDGFTGETNFAHNFAITTIAAPLRESVDSVEVTIVVDQSSVEVYAEHGLSTLSAVVYPLSGYDKVSYTGGVLRHKTQYLETAFPDHHAGQLHAEDIVSPYDYLPMETAGDAVNTEVSPERRAYRWLHIEYNAGRPVHVLTPADVLEGRLTTDGVTTLWINIDRAGLPLSTFDSWFRPEVCDSLRAFVQRGGNLLLTKQATRLASAIGRAAWWPSCYGDGGYQDAPANDRWNVTIDFCTGGNHDNHPLYRYVTGKYDPEGVGRPTAFPLCTGNGIYRRTDNNSLWADWYIYGLGHLGGCDYARRAGIEQAMYCRVLGGWGHTRGMDAAGIIEFYPHHEWHGTVLCIGLAAYQWGPQNTSESNVKNLTRGALDYLESQRYAPHSEQDSESAGHKSEARKELRSGQLTILREGHRYTLHGLRLN